MPGLEFKGKQHIYAHHLTVAYRPLVADLGRSVNPVDADDNLIIHGDNLHALKALVPRFAGRVKCVYIDPPYNTGNEGWHYNDNVNSPLMREWLRQVGPVDGEDLERHDKWLCMMWPRLPLLRELLSEDGVIFVSIDDNEQHHLRLMMDEVFGEKNFVETFIWKKKGGASNTETIVGDIVENIIMFAKDKSSLSVNRRIIQSATYPHKDDDGAFRYQSLIKTDEGMYQRDTMKYGVPVPGTNEMAYPPQGQRWTSGYANMMSMLESGILHFEKADHGWLVRQKDYFDENDPQTGVYLNLLLESGSLRTAKNELTRLGFGREDFDTPKPTPLITHLLRIATGPNDIVLDSFAGSGTTAHAVLALNKSDGGNRKFILVECEDYADAITAERVRRVISGVPGARDVDLRDGLGGSFTFCALGEPIDEEAMLTGEALPGFGALAGYLLYVSTGVSAGVELRAWNDDGLFYSGDGRDYYLLYRADLEWLRSNDAMFNEERARRIAGLGRRAVVFAAGKYIGQRMLTDLGIIFCQIPYEMHYPLRG